MAQQISQQSHPHPRLTVSEPRPPRRGPRPSLARNRRTRTMTLLDPRSMPADVPNPSHRHGTPSGPWPFLDLHISLDPKEIIEPEITPKQCSHRPHHNDKHCWCEYPQSLYRNWTPIQQQTSRILEALDSRYNWSVYPLVVSKGGAFRSLDHKSGQCDDADSFWEGFRLPVEDKDCRLHTLFIDNMASPIMQMLGTKYNIEPFFFSSSFGWIPSRYQESAISKHSDHITITLTFIHCINDPLNEHKVEDDEISDSKQDDTNEAHRNVAIKTNEFLFLHSNERILFSDILSLHMVRHPTEGHTIISYHAPKRFRATPAQKLRDRFLLTGSSVYWSKIFDRSQDPTFYFLSLLWYALYAWDESLEALYNHICFLESNVLENTKLDFTQELHRIRAHLLHYTDLLEDFKKTVIFVRDTHYPALDNEEYFTPEEKQQSMDLMNQESKNLLNEIDRLDMTRKMQDKRLTNVMQLGFSTVNIEDSKRMHDLTKAAVRDSAAMKQIAYLTMIFLPASFVATAFGMNVQEINGSTPSLRQYFAAAIPLTAITVWIVVALQIQIRDTPSRQRKQGRKPGATKHISKKTVPAGHELRQAFTSSQGDLVIQHTYAEPDHIPDTNDYNDEVDDHIYPYIYDHDYNQDEFKRQSIWKRLWWPISLTWYAFSRLQERRRKTKDNQESMGRNAHKDKESDSSIESLPLHLTSSWRKNKNTLTPAAMLAADVRSLPTSSIKSLERIRHPIQHQLLPLHPPPILKREDNERAAEEESPDSFGQDSTKSQTLKHEAQGP